MVVVHSNDVATQWGIVIMNKILNPQAFYSAELTNIVCN